MEVFQSPELWMFCSTSAPLCGGLEVDWEGVALWLCGDCFHCSSRAPREAAEGKGRTMALQSVRSVRISAMSLPVCTWTNHSNLPQTHLVIYKMGFIITELAVLK